MKVDYYSSSILKLQKDIVLLKKLLLKLRKYELLLIPIFAIPLFPLLFKAIHNIDIYKNTKLLTIEIVGSMIGGYSLTLWINKYIYDKKFKNTEKLLEELERFEKEE